MTTTDGMRWKLFSARNWEVLVTLPVPLSTELKECPFALPHGDESYCKVYLEDDYHLRLYFHFDRPWTPAAIKALSYPGPVVGSWPFSGDYWLRVDSQCKARSIWELGLENRPRHVSKRR